ncbi:MAG: DUF1592 domain-containing protein [Gammaproteobacteria bacterium]|nr:DUF1592 domain-containing protein [Gammaproteobacteria bacterium]
MNHVAISTIRRLAKAVAFCITATATWTAVAADAGNPALDKALADVAGHWSLLEDSCYKCHNFEDWAGQVAFDAMSADDVPREAKVWEEAVRKLRGGLMPPPGESQPTPQAREEMVRSLENALDAAAVEPDPGYVMLHRLNRTEYEHAIHDLLGLDIDAVELLPTDAVSHGFDNIADALRVSSTFIDQYISAARAVSVEAVGGAPGKPVYNAYFGAPGDQSLRLAGMPPGTRGGVMVEHTFPVDGIYEFSIEGLATARYVRGFDYPNTVIITVDDERVFEADIGGDDDFRAIDHHQYYAMQQIEDRFRKIRVPIKAGVRRVAATFIAHTYSTTDDILQPFYPIAGRERAPAIGQFSITGPFEPGSAGDTETRRRIFTCRPTKADKEEACARSILTRIAHQAYRRPVSEADIAPLMTFYQQGRARADFDTGIQRGLMAILASPNFLYRAALPPENVKPGEAYEINDIDLASRMSFFIWASVPDEELLKLAEAGRLKEPKAIRQQVDRMLADPRAERLVDGFAMQWLRVDDIESHGVPNVDRHPDFDETLLTAFKREMQLFLDSILLEDRSIIDLMTADHTFVNERLAKHYDLPVAMGEEFQRVTLTQPERFGLLGKGAILTATSYPHRTSPVLRGAWILENLMGTPPAAPPPGVDANLPSDNGTGGAADTVRAMLEAHRESPNCNSCHGVMDPLGVALENFDAVGAWRVRDRFAAQPILADGELAIGVPVDGPIALREALIADPEAFVRTITEKLLSYGLGRTFTHADMPTVRAIAREAAAEDFHFAALVRGVVMSRQFRYQRMPVDGES